jgi:hypothetical protein
MLCSVPPNPPTAIAQILSLESSVAAAQRTAAESRASTQRLQQQLRDAEAKQAGGGRPTTPAAAAAPRQPRIAPESIKLTGGCRARASVATGGSRSRSRRGRAHTVPNFESNAANIYMEETDWDELRMAINVGVAAEYCAALDPADGQHMGRQHADAASFQVAVLLGRLRQNVMARIAGCARGRRASQAP